MRQGKHDAKLENLLSSHDATVRVLQGDIADLKAELYQMGSR
jgi:hypothetical protein